MIQEICDLAVESAYSVCGLFLMERADVLENERAMMKMTSQDNLYIGLFHAGSNAEGVAVQGTYPAWS